MKCGICKRPIIPHNQDAINEVARYNKGRVGNDRRKLPAPDFRGLYHYCYPIINLREHGRAAGRRVCRTCQGTRIVSIGQGDEVKYQLLEV